MSLVDRWQSEGRILNIAHRGASGQAPENTLAAFSKALEIGADAIELDLHRTRDGHLVVIHNGIVDRTTGSRGIVADMSLKELKSLDAGAQFRPDFSDQQIPTFQEVIELVKGKAKICAELKVKGIEEDVVQTIEQNNIKDEVIVISFLHQSLNKVKQLDAQISTGMLVGIRKVTRAPLLVQKARKISADVVMLPWSFTTAELVEGVHKEGLFITVWTVNELSEMNRLIKIGVDGIATNYPERLKEVLG